MPEPIDTQQLQKWRFVIWSNEHVRWWRPGSMGYTAVMAEAGRYSYESAKEICENANRFLPKGAQPNEVMLIAPEMIAHEAA